MISLTAAAFDSYLPAFERMLPPLLEAYDRLPPGDSLKSRLADPIAVLRGWDYRWGVGSVPTSIAVFWGGAVTRSVRSEALAAGMSPQSYVVTRATPEVLLGALDAATNTLAARLRHLEDALGRDQPLSAARRRDRVAFRRYAA